MKVISKHFLGSENRGDIAEHETFCQKPKSQYVSIKKAGSFLTLPLVFEFPRMLILGNHSLKMKQNIFLTILLTGVLCVIFS